jgi:hypothetical protein
MALVPFAVLAAFVPASASVITWGGAQNISGDADVSTAGSLVGAFNLGGAGPGPGGPVANTTVNGVTFVGLALTGSSSATSGNFNLAGPGPLHGSGGWFQPGPFGVSASYGVLLDSLVSSGLGQGWTLTMSGLVPGASYQFQWWSSANSGPGGWTHTIATAGNSVTLQSSLGPYGSGVNLPGQFATGTFIADDTTVQAITFSTFFFAEVNGFQLRRTSAIPDTSNTFALFMLGLFGLAALRRKISKRQRA